MILMLTQARTADQYFVFFFNDTATTEIYTLSLHDALPICGRPTARTIISQSPRGALAQSRSRSPRIDRKSTRLNSSHSQISYAVFCLKKKKHRFKDSKHVAFQLSSASRYYPATAY